jgi:glycosyltransferase involved in cell wall biosynthesis
MPLVPMEAIEAGVPVVASPIECHRELLGGCPAGLLDADESRWPETLARLVTSADARRTLLVAERDAVPAHPRERMWQAYAALYRAVRAAA